ncbi:uncharacterized protein LOC124420041 [Lucilia cuprina]|uniref:uncharacterized protein LOC124420041 n=1 Tax=Lucilia cuprina TaxID=7375 RepID=UPI001F0514F8|nr:uncharacterized protein LOC124420041 [Lucilia cuprina]
MPRKATASESVAPTTTSTVNLRIPRFWKENPAIWFAQLDAQFENHNVVNESSKYFAALPEVLSQVTDIILQQPRDAYSKIKQRLIDHFSISEENRIKTLLKELPIGDKKPSFLLREIRNLANDGVKDEFLRTMWIQRLPTQAQAILATSSEPLDILVLWPIKSLIFQLVV